MCEANSDRQKLMRALELVQDVKEFIEEFDCSGSYTLLLNKNKMLARLLLVKSYVKHVVDNGGLGDVR